MCDATLFLRVFVKNLRHRAALQLYPIAVRRPDRYGRARGRFPAGVLAARSAIISRVAASTARSHSAGENLPTNSWRSWAKMIPRELFTRAPEPSGANAAATCFAPPP